MEKTKLEVSGKNLSVLERTKKQIKGEFEEKKRVY